MRIFGWQFLGFTGDGVGDGVFLTVTINRAEVDGIAQVLHWIRPPWGVLLLRHWM